MLSSVPDSAHIFDADGLETLRKRLQADPEQVRRVRNALLKECRSDEHVRGHSPVSYTHLTLPTTPYV